MRWMEEKAYVPAAKVFAWMQGKEEGVFLDSSLQNELGRFSIIGLRPYLKVVKKRKGYTVNGVRGEGSFESFLSGYLKANKEENPTALPITSGAIGYFSYDYGREKEGIATRHEDSNEIPESIWNFYDWFILEDVREKKLYLTVNGKLCREEKALTELQEMIGKAREACGQEQAEKEETAIQPEAGNVLANFTKEEYKKAVQEMIDYIIEGDIYIANMTQTLKISSRRRPFEVFQRLREKNPSPFGGYLDFGDFQVIMASPERFLKVKKGHVVTRPIKGTRKRGETPGEDEELRRELQDSEKDRSELLMIVDLERNDLNKVCVPGSVKVTELFSIETYATVFHLIANIEGDLEQDKTIMELIDAAFPGGSITGAPKYRAMEIIDELEHGRRGLYTGSVGYMTLDGSCDLNIVIRTAVHRDGNYRLGVGGGITFESELEFEYEETLQKAKAVRQAIGR